MQIPFTLRHAIEAQTATVPSRQLQAAAAALSEQYRQAQPAAARYITTETERLAYAATRMPATYAAARRVLGELRRLLPAASPASLLDLGAGTGAASWAAAETFAELREMTLVERDAGLIRLGRALAQAATATILAQAEWQMADLTQTQTWPSHDIVISSYALGELDAAPARQVVRAAWAATRFALVLIEPGTMRGFAAIRALRDEMLALGARLAAPCPHTQACPLAEKDWCHFAARVERTALQRQLKGGTLGYEDEKFSYLILTRTPVQPAAARVLRHPQQQPGRIQLELCAATGLQSLAVTKREKEQWKRARKVEWGEAWEN